MKINKRKKGKERESNLDRHLNQTKYFFVCQQSLSSSFHVKNKGLIIDLRVVANKCNLNTKEKQWSEQETFVKQRKSRTE